MNGTWRTEHGTRRKPRMGRDYKELKIETVNYKNKL